MEWRGCRARPGQFNCSGQLNLPPPQLRQADGGCKSVDFEGVRKTGMKLCSSCSIDGDRDGGRVGLLKVSKCVRVFPHHLISHKLPQVCLVWNGRRGVHHSGECFSRLSPTHAWAVAKERCALSLSLSLSLTLLARASSLAMQTNSADYRVGR